MNTQRTHVQTGLERLLGDKTLLRRLKGARVGLLVNPTSVTRLCVHAIEALQGEGVLIVRLFGPEHGVRAEAQDMEAVEAQLDAMSNLPVVSLYGHDLESLKPSREDVQDLDIVLADIQDIGARYYTYAYTVGLMMQVCGEVDTQVWVLDRPNPLAGEVIEGNVVEPECSSFVGLQPLAMRHGMTLGELAIYFDRFGGWSCPLEVVSMQGWTRSLWFDQTDLPWVMPSPNMPTLDTAMVYPGQCILEGTNLSEARGTTRPFELFGAPFVDPVVFKQALDAYEMDGVHFRTTSFKPMFQKHAHQICCGVQAHVTDRALFSSVEMTLCVIAACIKLFHEGFAWRSEAYEFVEDVPAIDLLFGELWVRQALESGVHPQEVLAKMSQSRSEFEERRNLCLIYT